MTPPLVGPEIKEDLINNAKHEIGFKGLLMSFSKLHGNSGESPDT